MFPEPEGQSEDGSCRIPERSLLHWGICTIALMYGLDWASCKLVLESERCNRACRHLKVRLLHLRILLSTGNTVSCRCMQI